MFSLLGDVLYFAFYFLVIQVTTLHASYTTCYSSFDKLSIDLVRSPIWDFVHLQAQVFTLQVLQLFTMPVVTRSMLRKQNSGLNSLSIELSSLSTENATNLATSSELSSFATSISSSLPLQLPSSALVATDTNFEISNSNNLEFSNICGLCTDSIHLPSSQFFQMESECDKKMSPMKKDPDPPDSLRPSEEKIMNVLMAISNQMMANTQDLQNQILRNHQDLQDQLIRNDLKLTAKINRLNQDHEAFKQQSRAALISLQSSPIPSSIPSVSNPISDPSSTVGGIPVSLSPGLSLSSPVSAPSSTAVPVTMSGSTTTPSNEVFQAQMFQLLNDTFSKLSTEFIESKNDGKSEWPKFSGEVSKFKEWYLAIMAQLSLPPWNSLYDSVTNNIVQSTSNSQLNGKLYAKLLVCLEGQVMKNMISRKHLRANGLLLFQELHQMYKPKNVPEVLAAKTAEFWSKLKRGNAETVDNYYNCFQELLDEISESRETISKQDAVRF